MNKKRVVMIAVSAAAVALVTVGSTMAYLISTPQAKLNHFTIGTLTPDIHENGSSTPNLSSTLTVTSSGSDYTVGKVVAVTNSNTGNPIPAYVRVQLVPTLTGSMNANGSLPAASGNIGGNFLMPTSINGSNIVFTPFSDKHLTITLNLSENFASNIGANWFYVPAENCFYYNSIVTPGGTTNPLLSSIQFTGTDAAQYVNSFHLDVLTDAVQAEGGAIHSGGTPANPWPNVIIDNGSLKPKP